MRFDVGSQSLLRLIELVTLVTLKAFSLFTVFPMLEKVRLRSCPVNALAAAVRFFSHVPIEMRVKICHVLKAFATFATHVRENTLMGGSMQLSCFSGLKFLITVITCIAPSFVIH